MKFGLIPELHPTLGSLTGLQGSAAAQSGSASLPFPALVCDSLGLKLQPFSSQSTVEK